MFPRADWIAEPSALHMIIDEVYVYVFTDR